MRRNYNPETLPKYKYPNLVAEFMETGCSICTLSEHMGLGRRQENDPLINAKLFGDEKIMSDEAIGLARLFGCEIRYLFADKLEKLGAMPVAYIRHYDSNKREERDMDLYRLSEEIRKALKKRPELAAFMRLTLSCTEQQIQYMSKEMKKIDVA